MTATTALHLFRHPSRVFALGAALRLVLGWPLRVYKARRTMTQLAALGEHGLHDIGLTVQDLRDAAALPLDGDPSVLLRWRVWERRRRR